MMTTRDAQFAIDAAWNMALEDAADLAECADPNDGRNHSECPFCNIASEIRSLKRAKPQSSQSE